MRLGVCLQALYDVDLQTALEEAASIGFRAVELPVDRRSPFVDLDEESTAVSRLTRALHHTGLEISALSNHQEGQLLLGPHGADTDLILPGDALAKIEFAKARLIRTADLARQLGVSVVCAFTGCEDSSRWFPWPLPDGYERMAPTFRERLLPVLDGFGDRNVRLALECHPRQFAYNLETALWALELVEHHQALAFNLDPANLVLAGMDPVVFAVELGDRVVHVHAKDCELVRHNVGRSGLLAHGEWARRDRGFRFRIPGWGDVRWKSLITELQLVGYSGVLAVEHEDPTMDRREGLRQAFSYLSTLVLEEPPPRDQWW